MVAGGRQAYATYRLPVGVHQTEVKCLPPPRFRLKTNALSLVK